MNYINKCSLTSQKVTQLDTTENPTEHFFFFKLIPDVARSLPAPREDGAPILRAGAGGESLVRGGGVGPPRPRPPPHRRSRRRSCETSKAVPPPVLPDGPRGDGSDGPALARRPRRRHRQGQSSLKERCFRGPECMSGRAFLASLKHGILAASW